MRLIASLVESNRRLIRDRIIAGIRRAQANGKHCGRPSRLTGEQKAEIARLVRSGQKTQAEVARLFSADPATVCRIVHNKSNQPHSLPKKTP